MNELKKTASYHEAGHVVAAYFLKYSCDSIGLTDNGDGFSYINYGEDQLIVMSIMNRSMSPESIDNINNISKNSPQYAMIVARNLCIILISGELLKPFLKMGRIFVAKQMST